MGFFDLLMGGGSKASPVFSSKKLATGIDNSLGSVDRYRNTRDRTLNAFGALSDDLNARALATLPAAESAMRASAQRVNSIDPLSTYRTVREENLGALSRMSDLLSGVGKREESAAAARLGLAGRPSSMGRDLLRSNRTSAALAPTLNDIFSNLSRDSTGIDAGNASVADMLMKMASARPGMYSPYLNMALAPLHAEGAALGPEMSALNALAGAAKTNTAGVNVKPQYGLMDITGALTGQVGDLMSGAGDLLGGIYGGRGVGGSGGAGGGGIDQATLMALITALTQGRN